MGAVGKKKALELIKGHQAATEALHAELRAHVGPSDAAKLDATLAKHKAAQQSLEDDAQFVVWTP